MEDALFYAGSGGGVTLSGGDPLAQAGFSRSLLRLCRERGIHTAIETSCYGPWRTVSSVLEYTDLMLFDLKHMDSRQHQRLTGVPNEPILENVKRARRELSLSMCARIPIIPGINDSEANLAASAEFVAGLGGVEVHLLPYNPLGETKRHQLEMTTQMFSVEAPDARRMAELQRLVESHGLVVHIGG
jgi:pyruvate formate lyase activating enzyme